ncbi:TetR/AcrR family transcriptional regulator [Baekduia soli]|uniref:TetR/AcrR family transcriptional regulator n=1 Tax=Baekduia soli TaxID=496014 RepID=A0A5B8TZQ2_9ACTN|nr:TetR/AcrR family transcriptional regulator [Baekduia soli]QEC46195.1 TetR/AcrR family transcriptional regulator [Baekduia soli]
MTPDASPRLTAAQRRERIEQAAVQLFARNGYTATTVEDIARAAGVTKPMLYRHFESKQELCVALLERSRDALIAAALGRFTPGMADPAPQVPAMLEAWLGHVEQHPDEARLLLAPIGGDPEVARVQRDLHARQAATQTALLREFVPGLDEAEAEPLGEIVRATLVAVALWWLDHPEVAREVPSRALLRAVQGILTAAGAPVQGGRR